MNREYTVKFIFVILDMLNPLYNETEVKDQAVEVRIPVYNLKF